MRMYVRWILHRRTQITPGHDANDYAIGSATTCRFVSVLDEAAQVNDGGPYQGQDRLERARTLEDMKKAGLVIKTSVSYDHPAYTTRR